MVNYSSVETLPHGAERHAAAGGFSAGLGRFMPHQEKGEDEVRSIDVTNIPRRQHDEEQTKRVEKAASPAQMNEAMAQRIAESLERALNDVHGTEVKFRVVSKEEGVSSFNFAVIDTETGQVVREFPPEAVKTLVEGENLQNGQGVFVDADA